MVTGDHPITAKAIAEAVGIINAETKDKALIFNSEEMKMDELGRTKFDAIVVPGWELQKVLDSEPDDPQGITLWN